MNFWEKLQAVDACKTCHSRKVQQAICLNKDPECAHGNAIQNLGRHRFVWQSGLAVLQNDSLIHFSSICTHLYHVLVSVD